MDNIYSDDNVNELTKKNFIIKPNKISLNPSITKKLNGILVIYAPWCETCVMSKKMWENLGSLFKYKFNIYALNAYNFNDGNQDLTLPLDVRSYPSYKFIKKNGEILNYNDRKKEADIIKFIINNID